MQESPVLDRAKVPSHEHPSLVFLCFRARRKGPKAAIFGRTAARWRAVHQLPSPFGRKQPRRTGADRYRKSTVSERLGEGDCQSVKADIAVYIASHNMP